MNFKFNKSRFSGFSSNYFKRSFFKGKSYLNFFNSHLNTQKILNALANRVYTNKVLLLNSYKQLGTNTTNSNKILSGTSCLALDFSVANEEIFNLLEIDSKTF